MNWSIRKRIWAGFLTLAMVFILNGAIIIATETRLGTLSQHIATYIDPTQRILQDFRAEIIESKMYATNWVFLRSNQEDKDELKRLHEKKYPEIKRQLRKLAPGVGNSELTTSIEMAFRQFDELIVIEQDIMAQLSKFEDYDNPVKKMLAEQTIENEVILRTAVILATLNKATNVIHDIQVTHEMKRAKYSSRLEVLVFVLAISVTAIGIALSVYFSRLITHPIEKMQRIIRDLGKGVINKVDHPENNNEIGNMVLAVNHLSDKLSETARFAEEIGNRNYDLPFSPLSDEDKLGKALLSMRDNIQKSEEDLLKTASNLIQRNQALEQYTFIISHNLRAPVATILGFTQLLGEGGLPEEDKQIILEGLGESAGKLDDVIHDLNRILEVKQQVHEGREDVRLSQLANDTKLLFKKVIEKENIGISFDFSELDTINTVKGYLSSIFYNLISNSIKYRREDIKTVISVKSLYKDGQVVLVFRDNGKGMDLEKCEDRLFGLYERFDLSKEGKGMGLYMIKTQVETMEGTIDVASSVDEGTEFRITLPVAKAPGNSIEPPVSTLDLGPDYSALAERA